MMRKRRRPWPILTGLILATVAVFIVDLPHGSVEAAILLGIAWIWGLSQWRRNWMAAALLEESIGQLKDTVNRWASGDLEARVYLDQEDPLDSLAHGMNGVAEVLKERTRDLGEDKDRLETILTSMANGIIIFGHGLRISLINQAAMRLFMVREDDPQGRHVLEIIRDTGLHDALDRVTREGITVTNDWSPTEDENVVIECTIAPTDGDLPEDARIDKSLNGISRRLEGPPDQHSSAVHREDRGTRKTPKESVRPGVGTDRAESYNRKLWILDLTKGATYPPS